MSKSTINILCPDGHRRKAQMSSNSNLFQVLENMCNECHLDPSQWGLIHQRDKCDLSIPWRLLNIPSNATLEMYKLQHRRVADDINVQLQLPDNSRYSGWFEPTVTLQEMLDWYRIQPDSVVAALDISMSAKNNYCPVCLYLGDEIIGEYALSNTTLRELGLNSGTAIIRYVLRPVTDDELIQINRSVDDKIVRKRQQQPPSKQQQEKATKPEPHHSNPPPKSNSSRSQTNSSTPTSHNEEYSIFRDPPKPSKPLINSHSDKTTKSLAEELGIKISLEHEQVPPQEDFRNFKFPQATKGKNLYTKENDDDYRDAQNVKPCDRKVVAYDVRKLPAPTVRDTRGRNQNEPPEDFYELTSEDLRSILSTLQKDSSTEIPLETRSMRERAQSGRHLSYDHIAIRIVVDSNYVLQGIFRPEEPTSRIVEFVQTHLICPYIGQPGFYIYTTPPRVVLSELRKPLSAYDLAPAAFIHLGHETTSSLRVKLASNVPIKSIDDANRIANQYVFDRARAASAREGSATYRDRPTSATVLATNRPMNRTTTSNVDDKLLREKLRKFIPGRK